MTKQEIIKLFWGASYGSDIDENGWKPLYNSFIPSTLSIDISECRKLYRPKLLRGIEDNNGWIKIEKSEDLPKDILEFEQNLKDLIQNVKDNKNLIWIYIDIKKSDFIPIATKFGFTVAQASVVN